MVPMQERANMRATLQTSGAANWKKYGYADSKRRPKHNKLGLLNSYYTFENEENSDNRAWVKFSSSSMDGAKSTKIENIKVLYRSPNAEMKVNITQNGKKDSTIFNEELAQTENFEMLEKEYRASFKAITFRFESSGNAEVLGVCFDCNDGIAVDNVPLRGSSGLDFTKMNKDYLREQIKQMNVRLMILQFGVNIVPYVLNDYSFYEKQLLSQLKYLKSISPDLDILVVGVSDMSRSRSGSYESYPNVVKIRNAQKNAAFKAGCAFWDLYEAMGGENSMISWVRNRPSLASPDYIHFNDKGATFVGEMLYDALMKSYDDYKLAQ
jgi:lysophospholipase L1-like esterase